VAGGRSHRTDSEHDDVERRVGIRLGRDLIPDARVQRLEREQRAH